jgi:hypothetical protein
MRVMVMMAHRRDVNDSEKSAVLFAMKIIKTFKLRRCAIAASWRHENEN